MMRQGWVLAGVTFVLAACSSGSGGGVGGGEAIPRDKVGRQLVEKICAAISGCCSQNGFGDEHQRCTQSAAAYQAVIDKQVADHPELTYDAQAAGNCIAKWSNALGTCNPKGSGFDPDDDPDCDGILRGTKAPGAACARSNECAGNGFCRQKLDGSAGGGSGVCIARKAPAAGDPCIDETDAIDPAKIYGDCTGGSEGFYCDKASNTCKASGGVGTQCRGEAGQPEISTTGSGVCDASTFCDFDTKKCVARPRAGEACSASGAVCADGTYCDQTSKTCVAKKAAGESCSDGNTQCIYGCDSQSKKCRSNGIPRDTCAGQDFD